MSEVSKFIRNVRLARDITLRTLSNNIGCHYQALCNWENGIIQMPHKYIPAMCRELNMTREDLISAYMDDYEKGLKDRFL